MAQNNQLPRRSDIEPQYKWNLEDIYESWETWQADYEKASELLDHLAGMKDSVQQNKESLKEALKLHTEFSQKLIKVFQYPHLMKSVESSNQEVSSKFQKANYLFALTSQKLSWLTPELLSIPREKMMKWIESDDELKPYRFPMEQMYHSQEHILDQDKEQLLSYFSRVSDAPSSIYDELATSDIEYPEVSLSTGEKMQASPGNVKKVTSYYRNQEDRRKISEGLYKPYADNKNAYAAIYNGVCHSDWAAAQARKYNGTLEAALHGNNIPEEVYKNLINTVKENTEPLQRYFRLRAKALGLEGNYHRYDGSISLTDFDKTYPYEEAKEHVLASVAPLGYDYYEKMKKAMSQGWLDVMEHEDKRPGAFSAGIYGVHPYMLLNYSETMGDMFTLGHELGHTLHTLYSDENQPYPTHDYTIFVAEVASTFNERLLLDHMMQKTSEPKERIELLTQAIDNIAGTFYVQTMFADYELRVHQMVEKGEPVTAQALESIFKELFEIYYGEAVVRDDFYKVIWARIPHFYGMPYYVYQYATSFAASAKLYQDVFPDGSKDEQALERYLTLLKSGGNDYPMNQLKKAGVDLSKAETIKAVINQLDNLVNQLEKELKKVKAT
ncbi:MAG: oligoendopeptidase F [Bacteroidales bacterium]|nr:oligoendopeptidase F [Bacteroidales bacterium]